MRKLFLSFTVILIQFFYLSGGFAAERNFKLAVTTSFHNSGLADVLIPKLEMDTGLMVDLLVVGTGQALKLGSRGDVDAILVHSRSAEEIFVENGFAPYRREIMYNDFVVIGSKSDPAGIKKLKNLTAILKAIKNSESRFISRGDDSGTHKMELALWLQADQTPKNFSVNWYWEVGAGMGAALNMASELSAYVISDRASWLNFDRKGDLDILFEGDEKLFNQYSYLPISKVKYPNIAYKNARLVEDWLVSSKAGHLMQNYKIRGQNLFFPNSK